VFGLLRINRHPSSDVEEYGSNLWQEAIGRVASTNARAHSMSRIVRQSVSRRNTRPMRTSTEREQDKFHTSLYIMRA
jgi:hypothetical protein